MNSIYSGKSSEGNILGVLPFTDWQMRTIQFLAVSIIIIVYDGFLLLLQHANVVSLKCIVFIFVDLFGNCMANHTFVGHKHTI